MTEDEYARFYDALVSAESSTVHDFDKERFFEGCLPIEVMAHRGRDTLRFGPMKPVGLVDPRTGRWPYAVVQLRQDNIAGDHFSLVGFQTQLKWGEQARVLSLIPGLEHAEFVRFGMVHRNTYINGPTVLHETWQTRQRPDLFFAGQISGVEGYVESAASGLIAGRNAAAIARGEDPRVPPRTTAIGALAYYVSHADPRNYQPTNITFGIMPPPDSSIGKQRVKRDERKRAIATRALGALDEWMSHAEACARADG
jgi:methylenetetrahydrofolate--tRNA-(uracil-5-)-methyltransferase